jgi:hypothetical protein
VAGERLPAPANRPIKKRPTEAPCHGPSSRSIRDQSRCSGDCGRIHLRQAVARAEHASSADLEALRDRGTALSESGHHEEAIPLLQQALTITRSQYGMFDLRQQDILKTLAASLTAMDRMTEAQDHMIYRVRTAEKNYGEGNPKVIS